MNKYICSFKDENKIYELYVETTGHSGYDWPTNWKSLIHGENFRFLFIEIGVSGDPLFKNWYPILDNKILWDRPYYSPEQYNSYGAFHRFLNKNVKQCCDTAWSLSEFW